MNNMRPYAAHRLAAICLLVTSSVFAYADTPDGDPPVREQVQSASASTATKATAKSTATSPSATKPSAATAAKTSAAPTAKAGTTAKQPALLSRFSTRGEALAQTALAYRGAPYRFGGKSAQTGFDCSSLVQAVCAKWGIYVPRAARAQYSAGTPVPANSLQPGDLVFFKDTYKAGISHVGIYIGDRKFLHAAGVRYGVMVSSLDDAYHRKHYVGARRMDVSKLPPVPGEEGEPQRVILDDGKSDTPESQSTELSNH